VEKRAITLATVPANREVVIEVVVLSADPNPVLVTSAEKRDISSETAPRNKEVVIEVAALSVDPNPALATSAEKRAITLATVPPRRDPVVLDKSSATLATRWVTCPVTVLRDLSPEVAVVTASTATSPDTWPETALKETLPVAVEVVEDSVATDLPVPVTDADKKVTLSLTALSPTPEARRRTRRSDLVIPMNSTH